MTSIDVISSNQIGLKKRLLLMGLAAAIQWIYVPTSLMLTGGIMPKTALDVFPVIPIWVVPYVLCYPLWVGSALWAVWKMEDKFFRAFINACLFTVSIGVTIFIVFPTYVQHPVLPGDDIFSAALRYVYIVGGSYDALPSAHIYMTTLIALFFAHWYPRQKWLWLLVFIIVALSTLFTGQHYILDVVAGAALGGLGYRFGWWRVSRPPNKFQADVRERPLPK